jgi:hypothetical protein
VKCQIELVDGYKLLSDKYVDVKSKLLVQCNMGHKYEVTYNTFQQGSRCPECNKNKATSEAEREIQELAKTITDGVICNDRSVIINPLTGCKLELDVYFPDKSKAIEYNGEYYHSFPDAIVRDIIKQEECERLGIDLLIIYDKDYIIDKQKELNKIKQFIGEYTNEQRSILNFTQR